MGFKELNAANNSACYWPQLQQTQFSETLPIKSTFIISFPHIFSKCSKSIGVPHKNHSLTDFIFITHTFLESQQHLYSITGSAALQSVRRISWSRKRVSGQFMVLQYKGRGSKDTTDDTNEKITQNFGSEFVVKPRYWQRTRTLKADIEILAVPVVWWANIVMTHCHTEIW